MTSTIETNNSNILKKIDCLYTLCTFIEDFIPNSQDIVNINRDAVHDLFNNYSVESAIILADYFSLSDNNAITKSKEQYNKLYQRYIKSHSIVSKLDTIYADLHRFFICTTKKTRRPTDDLPELMIDIEKSDQRIRKEGLILFSEYTKIKVHMYIEEVRATSVCKLCNEPMMVTNMSEQSCLKCGICQDAALTIVDDENIGNDAKNIKYGTYDPSKHCRYWLDRIQGREIADMSELEDIVICIKEHLSQDRIKNSDYITYSLIRNYLHKNGKSAYNEHIPLIRKLITGITPPQLTESELQKVNIYFIRIIKLYNTIKPSTKINCPYHPYIIYKILEQILQNGQRKTAILKCIHLQSSQTLIQNDKLWQKICEHILEFAYIPTDRNRI